MAAVRVESRHLVGTAYCFFFSSRRRHTRLQGDWSSDVCSSDLDSRPQFPVEPVVRPLQIFACLALGDGAGVSVNDTRVRSRTCVLRLRARPARVTPITSGAPAWPR